MRTTAEPGVGAHRLLRSERSEPRRGGGKGHAPRPLWWRNASAANAAAQRLGAGVAALGGDLVRVTRPTEANAVFATLPRAAADRLRAHTRFYDWADGETADRVEVRWMCSWATTDADVDAFLAALAGCL